MNEAVLIERDNRHFYAEEGRLDVEYPSVTTITSILAKGVGYEKWLGDSGRYEDAMKERDQKGDVGTELHNAIYVNLTGDLTLSDREVPKEKKQLFDLYWKSYESFLKQVKVKKVFFAEKKFVDPFLGYGGKVDIVAEFVFPQLGNVKAVFDWKTGKYFYDSQELQLGAYLPLVEAEIEEKLDGGAVVKFSPKGTFEIGRDVAYYSRDRLDKAFVSFTHLIPVWHWREKRKLASNSKGQPIKVAKI